MVIGGDKFSGKPGDWADVKTEIVAMIENAGYSYVTKNGRHPSSSRRTGNHDNIEDADLEKHFKKMWPTKLPGPHTMQCCTRHFGAVRPVWSAFSTQCTVNL